MSYKTGYVSLDKKDNFTRPFIYQDKEEAARKITTILSELQRMVNSEYVHRKMPKQ